MRRGRDSNPRTVFTVNTLAGCPIRPLWHLSNSCCHNIQNSDIGQPNSISLAMLNPQTSLAPFCFKILAHSSIVVPVV